MFLWISLILILTGIAFILALSSMSDFRVFATPGKKYSLFLIRNTAGLDASILQQLHSLIYKNRFLISIERLFKGNQSALVIFGPRDILLNFNQQLQLMELEDYSIVNDENYNAWEMGVKSKTSSLNSNVFNDIPLFLEDEKFWWQIVLQPILGKKVESLFFAQTRGVFFYADKQREVQVLPVLQNLTDGFLVRVPKPFSKKQILDFYQKRSIGKDDTSPILSFEDTIKLFKLGA